MARKMPAKRPSKRPAQKEQAGKRRAKKPATAKSSRRSDDPAWRPSPELLQAMLFQFLDLANLCLTSDQRVLTPLHAKELKVLDEMGRDLERIRYTVPSASVRVEERASRLKPYQFKLGVVRHNVNTHFNDAAKRLHTEARDRKLAELLSEALDGPFPGLAPTELVLEVFYDYRAEVRKKRKLSLDDDWLIPVRGWDVKPTPDEEKEEEEKEKKVPNNASPAAGEVLRRILDRCPEASLWSYSSQRTEQYVDLFKENLVSINSRMLPANERFTFLATLLGTPLDEAPWAGFLLRALVQGSLEQIGKPEWKDTNWKLRKPEAFRRPTIAEWKSQFLDFYRRLVAAGRPSTGDTAVMAFLLAASHRSPVGLFDGREAPDGLKIGRNDNAWNPEKGRKRDIANIVENLRRVPPDALDAMESEMPVIPDSIDWLAVAASAMHFHSPDIPDVPVLPSGFVRDLIRHNAELALGLREPD